QAGQPVNQERNHGLQLVKIRTQLSALRRTLRTRSVAMSELRSGAALARQSMQHLRFATADSRRGLRRMPQASAGFRSRRRPVALRLSGGQPDHALQASVALAIRATARRTPGAPPATCLR